MQCIALIDDSCTRSRQQSSTLRKSGSFMRGKALLCQFFPLGAGTAVVGVRVDGDAAAGGEETGYLNVFGVHELHEVLHDGVHYVLVEVSVAPEAEKIEFQGLGFHHLHVGNVADADFCKVRLACDGAQGSEFGAVEPYPVVVVRVLVFKGLQHFGSVILAVRGLVTKGFQGFRIACHDIIPPMLL